MANKKVVKPTAAEKVAIMIHLKRKYPQMYKPDWGKKSTGKSMFRGASGDDLAELQKRFGKK